VLDEVKTNKTKIAPFSPVGAWKVAVLQKDILNSRFEQTLLNFDLAISENIINLLMNRKTIHS